MDGCISQLLAQTVRDDKVVDAPTGILLTSLEPVRPPRVFHLLRILVAEGVRKTAGQQVAELFAFLVSEAGIMTVGLRILDVYLLVGHVQIAAEDDGLLLIQAFQVIAKVSLPRHAVVQTLQTVLRIGGIATHQEEVFHLQRHHPTLVIVHLDADAVGHTLRLMLREDGCATVAFLLGIVPIALIALESQIQLSLLHLRLLQTEEVGIKRLEYLTETLALAGSQTVHVPTDKFHFLLILCAKIQKKVNYFSNIPDIF